MRVEAKFHDRNRSSSAIESMQLGGLAGMTALTMESDKSGRTKRKMRKTRSLKSLRWHRKNSHFLLLLLKMAWLGLGRQITFRAAEIASTSLYLVADGSQMPKRMEQAQMNSQLLKDTARSLFANDKGLLAMDESNGPVTSALKRLEFRRLSKPKGLSRINRDHPRAR